MLVCDATRMCATATRPQTGRWCRPPGTGSADQPGLSRCRRGDRLASRRLELTADHVQIRERTGDQQAMGILGQAAVADLREPEDACDDADDMFHLGPDLGFGAVLRPRLRIEAAARPDSAVCPILRLRGHAPNHGRLPLVRPIAPDPRLTARQEARQDGTVGHVGRRRGSRVDEPTLAVDSDMGLHAEVPLFAFGGLMPLRVPCLLGVLRRTGSVDNRGIHNGAGGHAIAEGLELLSDGLEEGRREPMRFQQMPEPADRGFVGNRFPPQVDADERAHSPRVVQGLLDQRIGEVEPLLQEIDPQHPFDPHGASACPLRLRVHRLDHRAQRLPGHDPIHFGKKYLSAGRLAEALKSEGGGEGRLRHVCGLRVGDRLRSLITHTRL